MPFYPLRCPHCHYETVVERPMDQCHRPEPCPHCSTPARPVWMERVYTPFWTQPSRVQT